MSANLRLPARPPPPPALGRVVLLLALCIWGVHFLFLTTASYFIADRPSDLATLAARTVVSATGVGLCMAMYMLLRGRGDTRAPTLFLKAAGLSVLSGVILVLVGKLAFRTITPYYDNNPDDWFEPYLTAWLLMGYMWMQLAWSASFVGATVIGEMRRRDAQLAAVREATREAQMLALRLQINPHFLFNTLNTLSGFIVLGRTRDSERIVLSLSRFFRHTLTHAPTQAVPLSQEIDMLQIYMQIEIARFRDRLQVRYDIPPECGRALVPGLILLPLAENSIRHALTHSEAGIEIAVSARREGRELVLSLQDAGRQRPDGHARQGIGLSATRQHLAVLYGDGASMEAGPWTRGWRNVIRIPLQERMRDAS